MNRWLWLLIALINVAEIRASEIFIDGDAVLLTREQFSQKRPSAFEGVSDLVGDDILDVVFAQTARVVVADVTARAVIRLYKNDGPCGAAIGFIRLTNIERLAVVDAVKSFAGLSDGIIVPLGQQHDIIYFESVSAWSSIEYNNEDGGSVMYTHVVKSCGDSAAKYFRAKSRK
ncbi:MAG: hypothetical protein AB7V26_12260 [Lysobacterales bacterium]